MHNIAYCIRAYAFSVYIFVRLHFKSQTIIIKISYLKNVHYEFNVASFLAFIVEFTIKEKTFVDVAGTLSLTLAQSVDALENISIIYHIHQPICLFTPLRKASTKQYDLGASWGDTRIHYSHGSVKCTI